MTNTEYFKSMQINSETSSTSGETAPIITKTLIIFDFDDTLFCTKYFDTFSLIYQDIFSCKVSLEEINPCLVRELKQLESTIIELFINLQQNYDISKNLQLLQFLIFLPAFVPCKSKVLQVSLHKSPP